jgi:hypothetical protein
MPETSAFCPTCQQMRLFVAPTMNHVPHILASVFLCGLWLPVWIVTAMTDNPVYRCQSCGFGGNAQFMRDLIARQNAAALASVAAPAPIAASETVRRDDPGAYPVREPKRPSEVKRPDVKIRRE